MRSESRNLQKQRVLVTGSGGVLGTAVVQALRRWEVHDVAALRRSDCNLLDLAATLRVWHGFRPTVVIHLAGWVAGVQGNLSHAGQAFYENTQINLNVIEASRVLGVGKVVAAGTTAIYSDQVALPMQEADIWSAAPHGSEAAYGHAKRAMLAQLDAYYSQYGMGFGYLICTNLFGPNDRFDEKFGHVVPSLISRFQRATAQGQPDIVVWGDGSPTRDFLYADDAAEAFLMVAERGEGAYNLASGSVVTIAQLVAALKRISGFEGVVAWDTTKPKGQQLRSYDVSRLRELGWAASVPLEVGLERTYEWFLRNAADARR